MKAESELHARLLERLRSDPARLALEAGARADCLDAHALVELAEGRASEARRVEAFAHVAGCNRCLLALDAALEESTAVLPSARQAAGRSRPRPRLVAAALAAAALLLVLLLPRFSDDGASALDWAPDLAVVEPLFVRVTRSPADSASERLRAAYGEGQWSEVVRGAAALPAPDAEAAVLHGSALLLLDRPADARRVLAPLASTESGLAREAHWLAAQAELLLRRADAAESRLADLARTPGARSAEANALLARIRAARAGR